MRRAAAAAAIAAVALAGCTSGPSAPANWRDVTGVPAPTPTKIEAFANVDNFPNLVRLCIDGRAFVTSTRKGGAAWRAAPYFDNWCGTPTPERSNG